MRFTYITYADLARDVDALVSILPRDNIAVVFGVPRSGMIPATMVATALGVPLGMCHNGSTKVTGGARIRERGAGGGRLLLVDDSLSTGSAMKAALTDLISMDAPADAIIPAVVYSTPEADAKEIALRYYHGRTVPLPRAFQWNLFGSALIRDALLDMDGVLCHDPEPFDDDGTKYQAAIESAIPLHLPTIPVRGIVTNRIERWRGITHDWLTRHGVEYDELVMQPYPTAAKRRQESTPASFKAAHYFGSDAGLFIESHDHQAGVIWRHTGKPVLSIESNRVFQS